MTNEQLLILNGINKEMEMKCHNCNKMFSKNQILYHTKFLRKPYINCPHCGERRYLILN